VVLWVASGRAGKAESDQGAPADDGSAQLCRPSPALIDDAKCPLYPQKWTSESVTSMSALCQKRTFIRPPLPAAVVRLVTRESGGDTPQPFVA
jgi:hypothetical protein